MKNDQPLHTTNARELDGMELALDLAEAPCEILRGNPKFSDLDRFADQLLTDGTLAFDPTLCHGAYWKREGRKFLDFLNDGEPRFNIIAEKGNTKLPFYAYSTLPKFNCPGAGDCLNWCYSFKAWRYPGAFFRQCQNTLLERFNPNEIYNAINALPENAVLRLYVDGDINEHNIQSMIWIVDSRPDIKVYGYSKSLELIQRYAHCWPENWILNLSDGHNASDATAREYEKLPFVRGKFIARTAQGKGYEAAKNAARQHKSDTGRKAFACPQKCGTCTAIGHACGSVEFSNIDIIIGIH